MNRTEKMWWIGLALIETIVFTWSKDAGWAFVFATMITLVLNK